MPQAVGHQRETLTATLLEPASSSLLPLVAGDFAEAVARIWGEDVGHYLAASNCRRQVWHAWMSQKDLARLGVDRCGFLMSATARLLLQDAFGERPCGMLRALDHIGPVAKPPKFYQQLADILREGGPAATHLRHAPSIDEPMVLALATVGREISPHLAIGLVTSGSLTAGSAKSLQWTYQRLHALNLGKTVDTVARGKDPLVHYRTAMIGIDFPPAPFAFSSGILRPVASLARLKALASEHKNCLSDPYRLWIAATRVLSQRQYFYESAEDGTSLILLAKVGGLGWVMQDVRSAANQPPSQHFRRIVEAELSTYPEICPCWPDEGFAPFIDEMLDWAF
jgi:hypothetical protein